MMKRKVLGLLCAVIFCSQITGCGAAEDKYFSQKSIAVQESTRETVGSKADDMTAGTAGISSTAEPASSSAPTLTPVSTPEPTPTPCAGGDTGDGGGYSVAYPFG